jgi:hypothetical protein
MASGFMNMVSYTGCFSFVFNVMSSLFVEAGPAYLLVGQFIRHCFYQLLPGSGMGMTFGLDFYGIVYCFVFDGVFKLCCYSY